MPLLTLQSSWNIDSAWLPWDIFKADIYSRPQTVSGNSIWFTQHNLLLLLCFSLICQVYLTQKCSAVPFQKCSQKVVFLNMSSSILVLLLCCNSVSYMFRIEIYFVDMKRTARRNSSSSMNNCICKYNFIYLSRLKLKVIIHVLRATEGKVVR